MHTLSHTNSKLTNVMQNAMQNTIQIISHNYCNGETDYLSTRGSIKDLLTQEQISLYRDQTKQNPDTCDLSLYAIPKYYLRTFLRESFGNLIRGIITASGDDQCFDYIPSAIDEYFSILQALLQSQDPAIRETIQDMDLALYGDIYDLYMQSFDPNDESDPHYIGTTILNWNQGLTETPGFPAIIL